MSRVPLDGMQPWRSKDRASAGKLNALLRYAQKSKHGSGSFEEDSTGHVGRSREERQDINFINNLATDLPPYSIFGTTSLGFIYDDDFQTEIASPPVTEYKEWLLTNGDAVVKTGEEGLATPVDHYFPSLVNYDDSVEAAPTFGDRCKVENLMVVKGGDQVVCVSVPEENAKRIWVVNLTCCSRMIEFTVATAFTTADNTAQVTPTKAYQGTLPEDDPLTVYNTGNNFSGEVGDVGIAVWNSEDQRWQILSMKAGGEVKAFDFTTNAAFASTDASVEVTPGKAWGGSLPDAPATVFNSGNRFYGDEANLYGVALWNDTDAQWQMILLNDAYDAEIFEFTTTAAFTKSDPTVTVTPQKAWAGEMPIGATVVYNSGGVFYGDTAGLFGIASWNTTDNRWQILYVDPKISPFRIFDFYTNSSFSKSDLTVDVTPTTAWGGTLPGNPTTVYNSGLIFHGDIAGLYGIAVWNSENSRWQIIQLDCVPNSQNEGVYRSYDVAAGETIAADPSFSYDDTPVTVPLSTHRVQIGDLVQLEPTYEFTLLRAPRSALQIAMEFSVGDDDADEVPDISIVTLQYAPVATGTFTDTGVFLQIPHAGYKQGNTSFVMGGQAVTSFRIAPTNILAGDKYRLQVFTRNGKTMSDPLFARLTINESGLDVS